MTFYDDAEFAAIKLTRIAASEDDGTARSAEMSEVVRDFYGQHGGDGVHGLAVALARHLSAALRVIADQRGISVEQVLDEFEMHKLDQHQMERDWPDVDV